MPNQNFNWPVIGHQKITGFLQRNIANSSFAHAYLFHGSNGIGKTAVAALFAKSLLCLNEGESLPCNSCRSCEQFDKLIYPDLFVVERELNEKTDKKKQFISVNQIRELLEKINKRSFLNSYKIVIIKEAHLLNKEASNSLLKTLEEPTQKTVIILISDNRDLILPTIQSRCQMIKFMPIGSSDIYDYLVKNNQTDRTTAKEISRLVHGRLDLAKNLAQSKEDFYDLKQLNIDFLDLFAKNLAQRFIYIEKLLGKKSTIEDVNKHLDRLIVLYRDLLLVLNFNNNLLVNTYLEEKLLKIAERYSQNKIVEIIRIIEKAKGLVSKNINPKLVFENILIYL
jgi:DNA polymerase III subunit delta'